LRELDGPLVGSRVAHFAQAQTRAGDVVVGDLQVRIRAREPFRQVL